MGGAVERRGVGEKEGDTIAVETMKEVAGMADFTPSMELSDSGMTLK